MADIWDISNPGTWKEKRDTFPLGKMIVGLLVVHGREPHRISFLLISDINNLDLFATLTSSSFYWNCLQ